MLGQQLGLGVDQGGELLLQHGGDGAVQAAAVALQQALVGRIAQQGMVEAVDLLLAGLLDRQQPRLHQGGQQAVQPGQADR